jgi:hypothetical protein
LELDFLSGVIIRLELLLLLFKSVASIDNGPYGLGELCCLSSIAWSTSISTRAPPPWSWSPSGRCGNSVPLAPAGAEAVEGAPAGNVDEWLAEDLAALRSTPASMLDSASLKRLTASSNARSPSAPMLLRNSAAKTEVAGPLAIGAYEHPILLVQEAYRLPSRHLLLTQQ